MKVYERVYCMLRCHGHSDLYAMQMIEGAINGSEFYMRWIRRARKMQPRADWIKMHRQLNPIAALRRYGG